MRSGLLGAAALALAAGPGAALAQTAPGWAVTAEFENDMIDFVGGHTDRYYTSGQQISLLSPDREGARLLRAVAPGLLARMAITEGNHARYGFSLGQKIYTPERLDLHQPDPDDRPYAGWAYVGATALAYRDDQLTTLEVQLGVVGPSALAGEAQNAVHRIRKGALAQGWEYQLKDEVAFVVTAERLWRSELVDLGPLSFDRTFDAEVSLGTVRTALGGGVTVRLGRGLRADFGAPRIRPSPSPAAFVSGEGRGSLYAFAGVNGQLVARDIFLDGNTWQDSASVDKRVFVPELQAGLVARWRAVRISYTYVWRDEEFVGQNGHTEYGSLSITIAPGGGR